MRKETQKALEKRRLRGGRLLLKGWSQTDVARQVDVSSTTASRWAQMLEEGGIEALRIQRARGRPAGLDCAQRQHLVRELKRGAMANDFATEVWTLPRVGWLIERLFGRRYSNPQVWRILKAMNWSCQRPTGREIQRDEQAIMQWRIKRWPALKESARKMGQPIVFIDEPGLRERPTRVRTWSPKG